MYKKFKNEKWSEYYNSFFYSRYIFNSSIIFFDDVRNDKQYLIKFNKKIYKIIENLGLIKRTHRKENEETLQELISNFNCVNKKKVYNFDEFFQI